MRLHACLVLAAILVGCYGIPDDTVVNQVVVKAWGGEVGSCQELRVDLDRQSVARGACDAVDPSTGNAVPPDTIQALRDGIADSAFARENVEPAPECPTCATRSYLVYLSSASANLSTHARIEPAASLLAALAPLSPP
jgi:hypothetical protein